MSTFRFSPRPNRASEIRWREWGDAAFAEARERDVPILLAISAVWCHWCHVMDETSYSNPEIIREINDRYVAIRVDNDERPDVNRRYNMGGWPTTAFLTPDGEIVHGGTYIDPETMYGTVITVSDLWRSKRDDIQRRVADIKRQEESARSPKAGDISQEIVDMVGALVRGQYDPEFGGFGREPKFPQVHVLRFALDEYRRHASPELATMLHRTLAAMASGGMYDQIEGGFFRYATRRDWSIPHFEKMLEDNAELLAIYADAHATFPGAGYDRIVRDVVRWMDASLFQADTGLWSGSQDADEHYYALDAGERARHDAPFVDRTLYTSWNALAAGAYLRAGEVLGDRAIATRGWDAIAAIRKRFFDASGAIFRYDAGDGAQQPDLIGDAATVLGSFAATGHIDEAIAVARRMREQLEDAEHGGFYDRPAHADLGRLARRERPLEENAAAASALMRLALASGDDEWRDVALRTLRSFVGEYRSWGQFAASYANAVARALRDPVSIVVVGRMGDAAAEKLWRAARSTNDPDVGTLHLDPTVRAKTIGERGFPLERTAAYVCIGTTCSAPLTDEGSLARELKAIRERVASPA